MILRAVSGCFNVPGSGDFRYAAGAMGSTEKRVLVVEDSPVMRELFRLTFQAHEGVRLDHAGDGMAATQARRGRQSSSKTSCL